MSECEVDGSVAKSTAATSEKEIQEADFRTGETRGAKLEASTGEAKRASELSDKEIQEADFDGERKRKMMRHCERTK